MDRSAMSKKTSGEKSQGGKSGASEASLPEAAAATSARGPQDAAAAALVDTEPIAAAAPEPECDYRALYEQANDRWLRTRADFDNYRKRMQREAVENRFQVTTQTVAEFLRLHDQLSLALEHAGSAVDAAVIRQGLELTRAEFDRILGALGVTRIAVAGAPFDPAVHEAIAEEPSAVVPAGAVLREWKTGFMLGGRLLRPATVTVSSGPATVVVAGTRSADETGNHKQ
jgi:molecular chaperone GrpE